MDLRLVQRALAGGCRRPHQRDPENLGRIPSMKGSIRISEIFGPTVQGEGPLIGRPTVFVRTGGCDYRCGWCDTLYAVLPEYRDEWTLMAPAEILARGRASGGLRAGARVAVGRQSGHSASGAAHRARAPERLHLRPGNPGQRAPAVVCRARLADAQPEAAVFGDGNGLAGLRRLRQRGGGRTAMRPQGRRVRR